MTIRYILLIFMNFFIEDSTTLKDVKIPYSEIIRIPNGGKLVLPCKGEQGFECQWAKKNSPDIGGQTIIVVSGNNKSFTLATGSLGNFMDTPKHGDCSLTISNVTQKDTGTYNCTILGSLTPNVYRVIVENAIKKIVNGLVHSTKLAKPSNQEQYPSKNIQEYPKTSKIKAETTKILILDEPTTQSTTIANANKRSPTTSVPNQTSVLATKIVKSALKATTDTFITTTQTTQLTDPTTTDSAVTDSVANANDDTNNADNDKNIIMDIMIADNIKTIDNITDGLQNLDFNTKYMKFNATNVAVIEKLVVRNLIINIYQNILQKNLTRTE